MDRVSVTPSLPVSSPLERLEADGRSLSAFRCQVLVVGSGVAGLSAALTAAEEGAHVMVVAKGGLQDTNTRFAQGGMAAAVGPGDQPAYHADDTIRVGGGISECDVVDAVTEGGPDAVDWLLDLGLRVDREPSGAMALSREGGHEIPRILHCDGTATGLEIQRTLTVSARNHPRIDLYEHVAAIDLLRDDGGRVSGLVAFRHFAGARQPEVVYFEAPVVILATGGGGQIYRETTNPRLATADGLAMARRAGAVLQDMEFVQFHPTILYLAGAARFLISEVTRGAGAHLLDRKGHSVMSGIHPDGDLAPRDVVSRAIFRRMIESGDTHVYLDFSSVPDAGRHFPGLARITHGFGIDLDREPVPVRPAVHYFIGGVRATVDGRTNLEGLWAVGECASTGFHGANRMGSNSLLEGVVLGRRAGASAAVSAAAPLRRPVIPRRGRPGPPLGVELSLADMTYSLKSLMWRQVGIEREASGLQDCLERLRDWEDYLARLGPFTREGVEIVNMVQVAEMIALAALFREESRGAHFRKDYPECDPEWRAHTLLQQEGDGIRIGIEAVAHAAPRSGTF